MVNGEVPFRHDLLQIAIAEGVSQVPPDAQQDDHIFEVSPAKERWSFSGHDTPYQISLNRVCNRTQSTSSSQEKHYQTVVDGTEGKHRCYRHMIDVDAITVFSKT